MTIRTRLTRRTFDRICISTLLILFSTMHLYAQDKPTFVTRVEQVFTEKEPKWKFERKYVQNASGYYQEDLIFKSGKTQAAVSIRVLPLEKDARDVFGGEAIAFDNIGGKRTIKKSLPNLGDENYIWTTRGSSAWPTIHFRKGNVLVIVFGPSINVVERFARRVIKEIPPDK